MIRIAIAIRILGSIREEKKRSRKSRLSADPASACCFERNRANPPLRHIRVVAHAEAGRAELLPHLHDPEPISCIPFMLRHQRIQARAQFPQARNAYRRRRETPPLKTSLEPPA
ncbi:MAG: hypothetical protein ABSC55_25850 [Syntrophorhabdales bacterium]|jgi:hypothetical protein